MYLRVILFCTGLIVSVSSASSSATPDDNDAYWDYRYWTCKVSGSKATIEIRNRLTIKTKRGDRHAELEFAEDSFRKIKDLSIEVASGDNRVLNFEKKDLLRNCGFGVRHQVYSDICFYTLPSVASSFPYSITVQYTLELSTLFMMRGPHIPSGLGIKHLRIELNHPADLTVRHMVHGPDSLPYLLEEDEKLVTQCWEARDLDPIEPGLNVFTVGDGSRGLDLIADRFKFGGRDYLADSWREIGMFYKNLSAKRYDGKCSDRDSLLRNSTGLATVATLYDSLVTATRYVAVTVGKSGWQPRKAKEIRSTAYGDCKDFSTVLISDLRSHCIEAHPVLVSTRSNGPVDSSFPNFDFNHLITYAVLGNDTLWMDPTCQTCPFGDLPLGDENIDVLVVSDTGGVLVRTPRSSPDDNRLLRTVTMTIRPDRTVQLSGTLEFFGNFAAGRRNWLPYSAEDDLSEYMNELLEQNNPPVLVKDVHVIDQQASLLLAFEGSSNRPLRTIGDVTYLFPFQFSCNRFGASSKRLSYRRLVREGFPCTVVDSVTILFEDAFPKVKTNLPEAGNSAHGFAEYRLSSYADQHRASVVFRQVYFGYEVDSLQEREFDDYNSSIDSIERSHIEFLSDR